MRGDDRFSQRWSYIYIYIYNYLVTLGIFKVPCYYEMQIFSNNHMHLYILSVEDVCSGTKYMEIFMFPVHHKHAASVGLCLYSMHHEY